MYYPFNSFIVRTPSFPFKTLKNEKFRIVLQNGLFQEAIYIASPLLYNQLQKYLIGKIADVSKKQRIECALYRYVSRMSSRCTPFGLFAGVSIGQMCNSKSNTEIKLGYLKRHTRLDMNFVCVLAEQLLQLPIIRESIRYYPNTTLYRVGKQYRYVEIQNINSKKVHQIISIHNSLFLETILKIAHRGVKKNF